MVAVEADEAQVRETLARFPGAVVAAVNGPAALVISGAERSVVDAAADLSARGVRTRRLRVSPHRVTVISMTWPCSMSSR